MQVTTPGRRPPLGAPPALAALLLGATLLAISACVYRMPIQQGNHLDAATVAEVKPGMTRSQVHYLLGTPMVPGGFNNDRWDYDYYLKTRQLHAPRRGHVIVHFQNDLVERVESDVLGSDSEPVSTKPVNAPGP